MKRKAAALMLLAGLAGGANAGKFMTGYWTNPTDGPSNGARYYASAANYVGPHGQPVLALGGGTNSRLSAGDEAARLALAKQFPPSLFHNRLAIMSAPAAVRLLLAFRECLDPAACRVDRSSVLACRSAPLPGWACSPVPLHLQSVGRTQIRFVGPAGMKISWFAPKADGKPGFTAQYLEAPARYNFLQASIYRLKLSGIPNRAGVELYPTLEVVPTNSKTATFLAQQCSSGQLYGRRPRASRGLEILLSRSFLPDPQYQDLAATGPDEVVSSRLEPGVRSHHRGPTAW
jgi:hypothetical protein